MDAAPSLQARRSLALPSPILCGLTQSNNGHPCPRRRAQLKKTVQICRSIQTVRKWCRGKGPIVLVPTMGALHEGHLSLIRRARKLAGPKGKVVATIFVNPTQFGPKEDLSRYPRPLSRDKQLCKQTGVDMLFLPSAKEIYPEGFETYIIPASMAEGLCGASRPGHFRGVCTVVAKLFNIICPQIAVFGQKDFQQLAVIRAMARDLNFPVKIVGAPTVREKDGLALSSRNQYLNEEERRQAPVIRQALLRARVVGGSPAKIRKSALQTIGTAPLARIDYLEVVDAGTLTPWTRKTKGPLLVAAAVFFGKTRLIDNILIP